MLPGTWGNEGQLHNWTSIRHWWNWDKLSPGSLLPICLATLLKIHFTAMVYWLYHLGEGLTALVTSEPVSLLNLSLSPRKNVSIQSRKTPHYLCGIYVSKQGRRLEFMYFLVIKLFLLIYSVCYKSWWEELVWTNIFHSLQTDV